MCPCCGQEGHGVRDSIQDVSYVGSEQVVSPNKSSGRQTAQGVRGRLRGRLRRPNEGRRGARSNRPCTDTPKGQLEISAVFAVCIPGGSKILIDRQNTFESELCPRGAALTCSSADSGLIGSEYCHHFCPPLLTILRGLVTRGTTRRVLDAPPSLPLVPLVIVAGSLLISVPLPFAIAHIVCLFWTCRQAVSE